MSHEASPPFGGASALIFGGAQGIGRAVALEFARRGAKVAIADINITGAEETAGVIVGAGGEAAAIACDVTDDASVRAAVEAADARFGEIDILMNNVGVIVSGDPQDIPLFEWRRIIELNLFSALRSLEILLPKFVDRGRGHIVNTASFAGMYPYAANRLPYVASKAALIALSEGLALYLQPKGVRVSCLCPGPVATNVIAGMKTWTEGAPMRGPGTQYRLKTAEETAVILADGMQGGRIIIPTDEAVWEDVQRHAASPDAFVQEKIDAFARGDLGIPKV